MLKISYISLKVFPFKKEHAEESQKPKAIAIILNFPTPCKNQTMFVVSKKD